MNIRVRFEKTGSMRYVGHLDVMRYFQKAVKRAGLDVAYSEGYSPHQLMSFASPLGVGVTGMREYFDIVLNSSPSSADAIEALNKEMVDGLSVTGFKMLPDDAENAMSSVAAAEYFVKCKDPFSSIFSHGHLEDEKKRWFEESSELIVVKPTKRGSVEVDLKQLVHTFEIKNSDGHALYHLFLAQGSAANLKPDFVIERFCDEINMPYDVIDYEIKRIDVFTEVGSKFISLGDIGENIG